MPHRTYILTVCNPQGTLRRLILDNPPQIRIIDREAALDELDSMLLNNRRKSDKQGIRIIYEVAHWVSHWPTNDVINGRTYSY